jgi:hypothetical protein
VAHHVFGVRHHGPGSARSLARALAELRPDAVLVEGPPEADPVLPLATHPGMTPPVALLVYRPDQPGRAVYYPFARFSPEWVAIRYALADRVPVRFMDLPQAHQLAEADDPRPESDDVGLREDPLQRLAEAAGYGDGERWWEHVVEERRDGVGLFEAILEAMAALREAAPRRPTDAPRDTPSGHPPHPTGGGCPLESEIERDTFYREIRPDRRERRREAHMRQTIRAALAEGSGRVAVVCGAWHGPALVDLARHGDDATLLAGLPSVEVCCTWIPWTHGRLTLASGYGAGVESPGWYDHLWAHPADAPTRWLTRVAHLLRGEDLDASSAQVIDALRLADTLAALRGRPSPGLPELDQATLAVLCGGNGTPMRLIHDRLVVGEALGAVPDETPSVPLQGDLVREQRRLRLAPEASQRLLDLDLRNPTDLGRSHLLHRLALLGVNWGQIERAGGRVTGTFHELWRLQWRPELALGLIQAGIWGNTVEAAATAFARDAADRAPDLPSLTGLAERVLLAELPGAVGHLIARLHAAAALASDVAHLMDALPPLANVLRYGSVRGGDGAALERVVDGLVARTCIGLPAACAALDDDAAARMHERLVAVDRAVSVLEEAELTAAWREALARLADQRGLHGLVAGRACRLLLDAGALGADEVGRRLGLALSPAAEPAHAAAWVEGFLKGSGVVLLHDDRLWRVLDGWVAALPADAFTAVLPLLRRTFSTFPAPERRQIGQRAARAASTADPEHPGADDLDRARAAAVLPLVARMLGLEATDA